MVEALSVDDSLFTAVDPSQGEGVREMASELQGTPAFHDKSEFCEFHNDHDHYTVDCR